MVNFLTARDIQQEPYFSCVNASAVFLKESNIIISITMWVHTILYTTLKGPLSLPIRTELL